MSKWRVFIFVLCSVLIAIPATTGVAAARQPNRLTLLVVPANPAQLELVFDLANRFPAVIVSYQRSMDSEEPMLYAWDGKEWVYISFESYQQADFMKRIPSRAVLVGDESILPSSLVTASAWCPSVMNIPDLNTATLINSFAKIFNFTPADWKWFSRRYNLDLTDMNADRRRSSWYD